MKEDIKEFEYRDVDYVNAPTGWLEARLENRFDEGFEIWRDIKNMSWRGRNLNPPLESGLN